MLGLSFSSKFNWGYYIVICKTSTKKINVSFLEAVLCFFKSIIWVFKKFYRHVWAGNRNLHLDMLNEIQKQVCGTLVLHLMLQLIPWVMVKMQPV